MNVNELFFVNDAGELVRKITTNYNSKARDVAGSINAVGYIQVSVNGKNRLAHRVVWEIYNGEIPKGMQIDHINHVRTDNRIENLRLVSHQENKKNNSMYSSNSSGVCGVRFDKNRGKWSASIQVNGKTINGGRFDNFEAAVDKRKSLEIEFNFHKNNGLKNV
ncbi:MAG: HNH endonuclease [Bacteroidales bacterium]|nr:HNH endonuclease [Bacteroidales bacterium]